MGGPEEVRGVLRLVLFSGYVAVTGAAAVLLELTVAAKIARASR